ncbi:MAG: hypothetical protein P1V97_13710 [Planctomycetota bacterium]|nr:hypothetical protein [Planctomycetota bacterium]
MWAGITLLLFGLPCLFFGFWLKNAKSVKMPASKKSKRKKKVIDAPKGSSAQSFIWGGAGLSIIGIYAIIKDLL